MGCPKEVNMLFLHIWIIYISVTDGGKGKEQQMNKSPFMCKPELLHIDAPQNEVPGGRASQYGLNKIATSNQPIH